MEQGREVGEKARNLYPGGVLVGGSFADALKRTAELIADDSVNVIYEAAFTAEGYSTRADVIVCNHYCLLLCVSVCFWV